MNLTKNQEQLVNRLAVKTYQYNGLVREIERLNRKLAQVKSEGEELEAELRKEIKKGAKTKA